MKISTRGRYAIRVMLDLAEHNTGAFRIVGSSYAYSTSPLTSPARHRIIEYIFVSYFINVRCP